MRIAFDAPAEPGVENDRHRNGRPTDGKCFQRSLYLRVFSIPCTHMRIAFDAPAFGRCLLFLAGYFQYPARMGIFNTWHAHNAMRLETKFDI